VDPVDPESDQGVALKCIFLPTYTLYSQGGLEAFSSNWSWLVVRNFSSQDALFHKLIDTQNLPKVE
jgi:hypothetical protein